MELWWKGPEWLSQDPSQWPKRPDINMSRELPELRKTVLTVQVVTPELGIEISRFTRFIRVMAWALRFISNSSKSSTQSKSKDLSLVELAAAKNKVLLASQLRFYSTEYEILSQGKSLPHHHPFLSLTPFIGADGLIRVGGRLQQADLPESAIHPVILNAKSHTIRLLVEHTHRTMLHVGSSAVMAILAYSYHIPRLKPLLRSVSRRCMVCQKAFARPAKQIMGELPAIRSNPAPPFSIVGVDYAGPVYTKKGRGRNFSRIKTYLCIFVCLATRAVHIEAVADATTAAFLATLDKFVARRGLPSQIHSDNGSNFVGAEAELRAATAGLRTDEAQAETQHWASQRDIEWHFTPARAPHFGGLWESAVKAMKQLIRRTLSPQNLTFDELTTLAASVEAILNSRPLLPIHSTSDDAVCPLTPGHFLIGRPLSSLPQRVDTLSKIQNVRRWNLVKRLEYQLWQQWKKEYLTHLHQRAKWMTPQTDFKIGDIVLV